MNNRNDEFESLQLNSLSLLNADKDIENIDIGELGYKFSDVFDLGEIQKIQDEFAAATGVASIITEVDGTPITRPSNFCCFCNDIVRKTEKGLKNCIHSDSIIGSPRKDGPRIQRCLSGGLLDGGASIMLGDRHIANWLIGQIIDDESDVEKVLSYTDEIGVERNVANSALQKVTRMPRQQFENICSFLFLNARQLSRLAEENIIQAYEISRRKIAEQEIKKLNEELEEMVMTRTCQLEETNAELEETNAILEEEVAERVKAQEEIEKLNSELETKIVERTYQFIEARIQTEAANAELIKINDALTKEIAERIEIENALRKSKFEAEQANIAKSKFLANMSHEIRTPMNGIIGMTELALLTELDSIQREYLSVVKSSSKSLLRVLNDVLDYSKIDAGKVDLVVAPFDIREVTQEVITLFDVAARQKNLYIEMSIDERIPKLILGDSVRLRQVLSNLVGNGVKFTLSGGIKINIFISALLEDSLELKFVVSDTGIGIAEDQLDKLFKRFSRVDDSNNRLFGGTGLGLAISEKLVEMMGGKIGVVSKESVGSDFYFTACFRLREAIDPLNQKNIPSLSPFEAKKTADKKVLLVEDDKVSSTLAVIILRRMGLQVIAAGNGKEAIDAYRKEKFDLILMDINMPYMDGYSATSVIRLSEQNLGLGSHTPIIAMTAYALSGDKEKCLEAGMDDYITKPIDISELEGKVEKWINR